MKKLLILVLFFGFVFQNTCNIKLELAKKEQQRIQNKKELGALAGFGSGALGGALSSYFLTKDGLVSTLVGVGAGIVGAIVGYNVPKDPKINRANRLKTLADVKNLYGLSSEQIIVLLKDKYSSEKYKLPLVDVYFELIEKQSKLNKAKELYLDVCNKLKGAKLKAVLSKLNTLDYQLNIVNNSINHLKSNLDYRKQYSVFQEINRLQSELYSMNSGIANNVVFIPCWM